MANTSVHIFCYILSGLELISLQPSVLYSTLMDPLHCSGCGLQLHRDTTTQSASPVMGIVDTEQFILNMLYVSTVLENCMETRPPNSFKFLLKVNLKRSSCINVEPKLDAVDKSSLH